MADFATIEEITTVTGKTVDATTRSLAAQAVELATGLLEEVERPDVSDRDRYFLKLATAYQAAWLQGQPDYLTRNDLTSASQDGQSAAGGPDWLTLSPMARRAIKRLSWAGTRSVAISDAARAKLVDPLGELADDLQQWRPIA